MRLLASRLAQAYRRLFGNPKPFFPEWEEIVRREVEAQRCRAAAAPPAVSTAPVPRNRAIDAPTERTRSMMPATAPGVSYLGRIDLRPAAAEDPAAAPLQRFGAAASH